VAAVRQGDLERARELARTFSIFPGQWGSYGLPPVMKVALRHLGLDIGEPAPPYRPLTQADDAALAAYLGRSAFEPAQTSATTRA
jgi:dihydrodipicolinate synthase/N-acetylneuraminate lyase